MAVLKAKNYLRLAAAVTFMVCTVIFTAAIPLSCRLTEDGIEIINGDGTVPKILSYQVETNSLITVLYSEKIKLNSVRVESLDGLYQEDVKSVSYSEAENSVQIELCEETEIGTTYYLTGNAEDENGNSLKFSLPFTGFNENPAALLLSEVRSKHTTSSGVVKKAEFVELYVKKGGNTAGLEIVSGSAGEDKKYVFPVMEVQTGEYITVHFMKNGTGNCIDEREEDLTLSDGEATSSSRDLWIDNSTPLISDNDVIVLRDSCRNAILDAVLFSGSAKTEWYTSLQKTLAQQAFESQAWAGGMGVEYAACSDGVTSVRTLCRKNFEAIPAGREDWAVFVTGTPGSENTGKLYE